MDTTYIVIRPAPDLPPGVVSWSWNGQLMHRTGLEVKRLIFEGGIAVPTGRVEQHAEYGEVEIYEVRPTSPAPSDSNSSLG